MKKIVLTVAILVVLVFSSGSCAGKEETTELPVSGQVLFSDEFSNESSGWDIFNDENGKCIYKDGWLHITSYTLSDYDANSRAHQHLSDFVVEVETKLVAGSDENWHQVLCRMDSAGNSYFFEIGTDGTYAIGIYENWEATISLVETTYSTYIYKGKDVTNLIRVECIGSKLSLSVNGHLLADINDSTLTSGDIGLGASSWGGIFTEVAFDNIFVTYP